MDYIIDALNSLDYEANSKSSTYYNSEGIQVPRVTEILSRMIHSDGLMYWANSLGLKGYKYRETLNKSANIGTIAHSAIEKFLKTNIKSEDNAPFLGFLLWYEALTQGGVVIEVLMIEHRIACKWFGGTLDCLMRINGKIYLVDFKTSNHVTFSYFLQLAAYRYMLRVVEGIEVDGVIVLQLDKDEPGFNEYLLDFIYLDHLAFMNHCELTFMSLVYAYYNVCRTEEIYKGIF